MRSHESGCGGHVAATVLRLNGDAVIASSAGQKNPSIQCLHGIYVRRAYGDAKKGVATQLRCTETAALPLALRASRENSCLVS